MNDTQKHTPLEAVYTKLSTAEQAKLRELFRLRFGFADDQIFNRIKRGAQEITISQMAFVTDLAKKMGHVIDPEEFLPASERTKNEKVLHMEGGVQ